MMKPPTKKIHDRLVAGIKKFQPLLRAARSRDVNENDTVVILNDLFAEVFGFDKYFELTSEFAIRGTYCDLAVKIDGKLQLLVEAKAVGLTLKDSHVKQAVDYAANQGVEWVLLTNGVEWKLFRVIFAKPIGQDLALSFDFLSLDPRNAEHIDWLHLFTREGWAKGVIRDFYQERQALSPYSMGAAIVSPAVIACIRRELKRISPDVRLDAAQIEAVLRNDVLKRDIFDGVKFAESMRILTRNARKPAKPKIAEAPKPTAAVTPAAAGGPAIAP